MFFPVPIFAFINVSISAHVDVSIFVFCNYGAASGVAIVPSAEFCAGGGVDSGNDFPVRCAVACTRPAVSVDHGRATPRTVGSLRSSLSGIAPGLRVVCFASESSSSRSKSGGGACVFPSVRVV